MAAGTDGIRSWQRTGLWLGVLLDFGNGVDDTTDETHEDSRHTGEGHRCVKEDQPRDGDGELVQGSHHGVCSGRRHSHTPGGCVGNKHRRHTGENHRKDYAVALERREVAVNVGRRPVFSEDGKNDQHGDGKEVVVEHSLKEMEE